MRSEINKKNCDKFLKVTKSTPNQLLKWVYKMATENQDQIFPCWRTQLKKSCSYLLYNKDDNYYDCKDWDKKYCWTTKEWNYYSKHFLENLEKESGGIKGYKLFLPSKLYQELDNTDLMLVYKKIKKIYKL
jgi:hypothetical protein